VGGVRLAAAPEPNIQAVERSAVRRRGRELITTIAL
jgi:hypothetical protein